VCLRIGCTPSLSIRRGKSRRAADPALCSALYAPLGARLSLDRVEQSPPEVQAPRQSGPAARLAFKPVSRRAAILVLAASVPLVAAAVAIAIAYWPESAPAGLSAPGGPRPP